MNSRKLSKKGNGVAYAPQKAESLRLAEAFCFFNV